MNNYKVQSFITCCCNCIFSKYIDHHDEWEYICTKGLKELPLIDYTLHGEEFSNSIHAFYDTKTGREVDQNGICDDWESGGINKGAVT